MGIQTNANQLAAAWKKRAQALQPLMSKATADATKTVYAESKKQMKELIYDKPVPTRAEIQAERKTKAESAGRTFTARANYQTKKGTTNAAGKKKAWRRTGNLQRSEKKHQVSAYVGIISNDAKYAAARHDMGTDRAKKKKKCRYPAPWRAKAIDIARPKVRKIYRDAMRSAIRQGIVPGFTKP